jgi:tetratricopeptide (TPR) repeat protein
VLVTAYAHLNDPSSEAAGTEALSMYEQLGDLVGQANVLNNLGVRAYYQGHWNLALDYWNRGRAAREKAGDVVGAATQVNNLGEIYSDQGRYDEAAEMFRTALRVWRSAHFPVGIALATSNLGRLAARTGRHDEADKTLREAINLFEQQGAESFIAETMIRLAENYVLAGDPQSGIATIEATLARLSGEEAARVLMPNIRLLRAYALAQEQRWNEAIEQLTEAVRQAGEAHGDFEHALALDALCRVTQVSGIDTPESCASEAHQIFTKLGVVNKPEVPLPAVATR